MNSGFKFLYGLEESVNEMISKWSEQDFIKELEYVRDGTDEYIDSRGKINFELTEPINMVGLITSKKGTIRANHFHPQQEQKCLLKRTNNRSISRFVKSKFSKNHSSCK